MGTGLTGAALVGGAVLVSSLTALLPQFRYESQIAAMLPFFVWAAALGVGEVSQRVRAVVTPWRANLGLVSLVPYAALLATVAVTRGPRGPQLPVWWAVVAAAAAAAPFLVAALRRGGPVRTREPLAVTPASQRGTFLLVAASMILTWSMTGPRFTGALLQVVVAAALALAALRPNGLADAARSWGPFHWGSLMFASLLMWAGYLLWMTTGWLEPIWARIILVLLAGLPLAVVNRIQGGRTGA